MGYKMDRINFRNLFRFRDNYGRLNVPFIATLGGFVLVIIIVISLAVINSNKYQYSKDMTYVDNVSTYASYMDFAAREEMYMALNSALRENGVSTPPPYGGLIREGTYEQGALGVNKYVSNFVVDVAEAQQSYRVYLVWGGIDSVEEFDNYVMLRCVEEDQKIYENFDCKEPTPLSSEKAAKAENYLPHVEYSDEDAAIFTLSLGTNDENETIVMNLWTCGDEDLAKKYEKLGRDWLENETMIDLEQYKIEVRNTCDGAAI